jgi:hypothetical protein
MNWPEAVMYSVIAISTSVSLTAFFYWFFKDW